MNGSLLVFGVGLTAWWASLLRPSWTRRCAAHVQASWRIWAPPVVGLLAVAATDPLLHRSPEGIAEALGRALTLPGIAARLGLMLFIAIPLAADAWLPPSGARTFLASGWRLLCAAIFWGAAPGVAAATVAHAFSAPWSNSLGGTLAPWARGLASVVVGATSPAGAAANADPALPSVIDAMVAAALLAHLLQRAVVRRWQSGAWAWRWRTSPAAVLRARWTTGLLLVGIVLVAFALRWQFLIDSSATGYRLSADGQSYFDEALDLGRLAEQRNVNLLALFFSGSTWFREPVFIYLLHGWLAIFGPQTAFSMYLTVVASLLWIVAVVAAIWALLGRWPALLTGFLLAIDDMWVRNAVIGLREEVTGLLLASAVALLFSPWARARRLLWLAPLPVALATLTRLDALPLGAFALVWAGIAQRWGWRRAVGAGLLAAIVLVPAFGGYVRSHGSAMPEATVIATNNWLDEFQDRIGTPGFERDRQVTAFEYLFHYHTPLQVAFYTVRGAGIIYSQFVFSSPSYRLAQVSASHGGFGRYLGLEWHLFVPLVFGVGCLLLLTQWRRWRTHWLPVALCVVGVLPPIGFSAGVPGHLMFQTRYGYLVAPFANAIVAWTVCLAAVAVWRWLTQTQDERRKTNGEVRGVPSFVLRPSSSVLRRTAQPAAKDVS